jgi:hypothetical protein
MKPLAKVLTGTAVLTLMLAGCASKAAGPDSAAAGNTNPSASQSAPVKSVPPSAVSPTGSAPLTSPAAPASPIPPASGGSSSVPLPAPSKNPGTPGSKPSAASTDQVKYTSPEGITVSGDGRTLATPVQWGGCTDQPELLVTAQDAAQVVVEVKTVTHFRMGVMCPNIARVGESSATLTAALGNRQVIDAISHSVIRTH